MALEKGVSRGVEKENQSNYLLKLSKIYKQSPDEMTKEVEKMISMDKALDLEVNNIIQGFESDGFEDSGGINYNNGQILSYNRKTNINIDNMSVEGIKGNSLESLIKIANCINLVKSNYAEGNGKRDLKASLLELGLNKKYFGKVLEYSNELKNKLKDENQDGKESKSSSENLKNNKKDLLKAVEKDGKALEKAGSDLKNDKEFVLKVIKNNWKAFEYISEELKNDKEFVLESVKHDGKIIKYVSKELKNDLEVILEAVKHDLFAIKFIGEKIRNNKKKTLKLIKQDPRLFGIMDFEFRNDKDLLLEAIKQDPKRFGIIGPELRNDKELALAAIKQDGRILLQLSDKLKNDKKFMSKVIEENEKWSTLFYIDSEFLDKKQKKYIKRKKEQLKEIGISKSSYKRFDFNIDELIKNRDLDTLSKEKRPIALVAYPKDDRNGAFENNDIKNLIDKGYRVIYYEINEEEDFYSALNQVGTKKPIDLLVIGGHGNKGTLGFGGEDLGKNHKDLLQENEYFYLDLLDKNEMMDKDLSSYLKDESLLVLESCSVGKGKENGENLANVVRDVFHNSKIIAPTKSVRLGEFEFNEKNKVLGYSFGSSNSEKINYKIGFEVNEE